MADPVEEEQEIDPEYVESHLQMTMGLIWDQVTTALGNQAGLLSSAPKIDLQPRPPRLGVGAAPAQASGSSMTRDAVRLQGRLAGSKRKRNENGDDVVPLTNGVASKSGDNDDSDEESRVKAVSKKGKPKSVFDKFPVPASNKKKQSQPGPLAAAAPKPTRPLATANEPALSKARSPGAICNGVPIIFPTASSFSNGTPAPQRTPSPARSTSIPFGGSRSRSPRSISKAARRLLKQKAILQLGRLEIVAIEAPARQTGPSGVTAEDPPPPPLNHQVNKGKGKEKETEMYADNHVPLTDLGMPRANGKPHTPPPREDDPAVGPTTPHPPRIRRSLPNGSTVSGKSVPQLGPTMPMTQPNQEPDSPKKRKRKRNRKKKKHQAAGDANSEEVPKSVSASMVHLSDEEK